MASLGSANVPGRTSSFVRKGNRRPEHLSGCDAKGTSFVRLDHVPFERVRLRHMLLTERDACDFLLDVVGARRPCVLSSRELNRLLDVHEGLKEVLEESGGLRRLVEKSNCALAWTPDGLRLGPRPKSLREKALSASCVVSALRVLAKVRGGSVKVDTAQILLELRDDLRRPVHESGGLHSFVEKQAAPHLWCVDGSIQLAATHLGEFLHMHGGSVNSAEFAEIRKHYPGVEQSVMVIRESFSWTERAKVEAVYLSWRTERFDVGGEGNARSLDWWYGEACLVCLVHCPLKHYHEHSESFGHLRRYQQLGGLTLRPNLRRLGPLGPSNGLPSAPVSKVSDDEWTSMCGELGRVLVLGEADFSFSRAMVMWQQRRGKVSLVATSFLEEHDPAEPEVLLKNGMPVWHKRVSLSTMDALQDNIRHLQEMDVNVVHGVDATNLQRTLLQRGVCGAFDAIVFPFPQASTCSSPHNAPLVREFFRNAVGVQHAVECDTPLAVNGVVVLIILHAQFATWDVALFAQEAGLRLAARFPWNPAFHQSRNLAGQTWSPEGAEVYVFRRGGRDAEELHL